jgi:sugar/nucleoside kinase (ribokinase family)
MWLQQGRELVDKQPVLDSLLADARARLEAHGRFAFDVSTRFRFQSGNDNSPSEDARHTYMLKGITEELEARFRGKGYKTTTSSSTYITVELP